MATATIRLEPSWLAQWRMPLPSRTWRSQGILVEEKRRHRVFPPGAEIFNAFDSTPFASVRVVILGQDPYHGEAKPTASASPSSRRRCRRPRSATSTRNSIKTSGARFRPRGPQPLGRSGVLLLNTVLTVRAHKQTATETVAQSASRTQ